MTQHGKRYPNGGKGNIKSNIKGAVDKNAYIKPILLKILTKVKFSCQNDDIIRNSKDCCIMGDFRWDVLNLGCRE